MGSVLVGHDFDRQTFFEISCIEFLHSLLCIKEIGGRVKRYLDPTYSIWISADPALGDYIPQSSTAFGAHDNNTNLPGMGGMYNHINCDLSE